MRPGILVQRRNKEEVVTPLENKENIEEGKDKMKEKQEPKETGGNGEEVMPFSPLKDQVRICLIEKVVNYLARNNEMVLPET